MNAHQGFLEALYFLIDQHMANATAQASTLEPVTRRCVVEKDQVPRLLAAKIQAAPAHGLDDVAIPDIAPE